MLGKSQAEKLGKRAVARLENVREEERTFSASRRDLVYQARKVAGKGPVVNATMTMHTVQPTELGGLEDLQIGCESKRNFARWKSGGTK